MSVAQARALAHHTLDLAREGQEVPTWAIVQALIEVGDLDYSDLPLLRVKRAVGSWELGEYGMLRPASWVDVLR